MKKNEYIFVKEQLFPIYNSILLVFVVSNSADKLREYFPEYDRDYIHATTYEMNWMKKGRKSLVILINPDTEGPAVIDTGTLAHESLHVVNFLFEYIDHKPSFSDDEPQAYLLGFVYRELYRFLHECGKLKLITKNTLK